MKERPILLNDAMVRAVLAGTKTQTRRIVKNVLNNNRLQLKGRQQHVLDSVDLCPFGQPGDRLWVREAWFDTEPYKHAPLFTDRKLRAAYRADDEFIGCHHWRPSIHMPRWASQTMLEITDVRVDRLQDISEADAIAEGIERSGECNWRHYGDDGDDFTSARHSYRSLWQSIYGTDSWNANPWVWVIEFRKVPA